MAQQQDTDVLNFGVRFFLLHLDRHCAALFILTREQVTECVGGARRLREVDLQRPYKSYLDPRLNGDQALECAMFVVGEMRTLDAHLESRLHERLLEPVQCIPASELANVEVSPEC